MDRLGEDLISPTPGLIVFTLFIIGFILFKIYLYKNDNNGQ